MRTYDANTRRKTNRQFHQLEKNMFEKNSFSYVAIVTKTIDSMWCNVKLVPSVSFSDFDKNNGYQTTAQTNPIVTALIPADVNVSVDDVVLVIFTDVNSMNTIRDLIRGKNKQLQFIEHDQTKHSINFGIIVNKIL